MPADSLTHPGLLAPVHVSGAPVVVHRLNQAESGRAYTVREVTADPRVPERARQLEEIGFCPGEQVRVMTRGFPGGDPLVVRIGQSTFALRGAEAACVQIEPSATRSHA